MDRPSKESWDETWLSAAFPPSFSVQGFCFGIWPHKTKNIHLKREVLGNPPCRQQQQNTRCALQTCLEHTRVPCLVWAMQTAQTSCSMESQMMFLSIPQVHSSWKSVCNFSSVLFYPLTSLYIIAFIFHNLFFLGYIWRIFFHFYCFLILSANNMVRRSVQ